MSEQAIAGRLRELHAAGGFWAERWGRAGDPPAGLAGLVPVAPAELAADEAAHPPFGTWRSPRRWVRVGVPTRPSPIEMLVFSADDLAREARIGARTLARAGLAPGLRETNTLPGGLATPGSLVVGDAVEALGALDMPVGPIDAEAPRAIACDFWSRVRPDFAVVDVAGARALAGIAAGHGGSVEALGICAVALLTDLRDPEPEVPALGVPVRRIVGLAEAFSLLAVREDDGLFHPPADEVACEIVDGRLLVTTLGHGAALVRFDTGVRAEPTTGGAGSGFRLV